MQDRDESLDILRSIAFIGLIIAHVNPPVFLMQLRNFDVPMMVFISGVAFAMSPGRKKCYIHYVMKRFVRIILPTWLFLFVYYFIVENKSIIFTFSSFTLLTWWYVWIMRVFFVISLFAPLVYFIVNKVSLKTYIVVFCFLLLLYEFFEIVLDHRINSSLYTFAIMNFPYILVFSVGVVISRLNSRAIVSFAIISFVLYATIAFYLIVENGNYVLTDEQKYPPRLYYLSYAFVGIFFFWINRKRIMKLSSRLYLKSFLQFVGAHTMWIYFWHIIFLEQIHIFQDKWILRFFFVFMSSTCIAYLQHIMIKKSSVFLPHKVSKYVKIIFDG